MRSFSNWEQLGGSGAKHLPVNAEDTGNSGWIPGSGRSPGGGHGNLLQDSCLEIPWREESGGLQSMRSQRLRHHWACIHTEMQRESCHHLVRVRQKQNKQEPQILTRLHYNQSDGSKMLLESCPSTKSCLHEAKSELSRCLCWPHAPHTSPPTLQESQLKSLSLPCLSPTGSKLLNFFSDPL